MKKMTSAVANKLLKSLEEDKAYWVQRESESCSYTAAVNEVPVIPEYDFMQVSATIQELDEQICIIKHAINVNNTTAQIPVGEEVMSVDTILVKMAQLNKRKTMLDYMRKQLPKTRVENVGFGGRAAAPEYRYINYDMDVVKQEYERISESIMQMQIALDKYNQTVEFEVAI